MFVIFSQDFFDCRQ